MRFRSNDSIAGRLDEVARLYEQQGANRFRVHAYRNAADTVRGLEQPLSAIFDQGGLAALEELPSIGPRIARSIAELVKHGRLPILERLRGAHDFVALLRSVPGIGPVRAEQLHHDLGLHSLEDLEAAAHDGRLATVAGFGEKRLAAVRDSLAHRLGRLRSERNPDRPAMPPLAELLDVDREYRAGVLAGTLTTVAPHRFNPERRSWLPILHTQRGARHYTALFSNTAQAHAADKTRDWVILFHESSGEDGQCTVITAQFGSLRGHRIVRGREKECVEFYALTNEAQSGNGAVPCKLIPKELEKKPESSDSKSVSLA